MEKNKIATTE